MRTASGPRVLSWFFTLNNYTPEDVDRLATRSPLVSYICFGKEVGDSGNPHLQGVVYFKERKRMAGAKKLIGRRAWCEPTRDNDRAARYCKKEGDFTTYGSIPSTTSSESRKSQKDTDPPSLEDFKVAVRDDGVQDLGEIMEMFSDVYAHNKTFVLEYMELHRPQVEVEYFPLRSWQSDLNETLNRPPHKRQIIFVVDKTGNSGKSWFARYYRNLHGGNKINGKVQILVPSKKADMCHALQRDKRVYFMDCPRSKQGVFIQYDFLEELKNGMIFSSKYNSKEKEFEQPHVVVLMNEMPDPNALSADRYSVIELN